jgi:O-antigen/teichoic acid export membrane protein
VGRHAAAGRLAAACEPARRSGTIRSVSSTAGVNVGSSAAAAIGGAVLARALGPGLKGDYAAIVAWSGIVLMLGDLGQPAALCYYVARQPRLARGYVATSRAMMLMAGSVAMAAGLALAPLLAHGDPRLTLAYRIVFSGSVFSFASASYSYSLQARNPAYWNAIRMAQPLLSLAAIGTMWAADALTLDRAAMTLVATAFVQLCGAYVLCHRARLAPGRARRALARPLAAYGIAQLASVTPYALNASLDQLILSQLMPAADLGRYSVAVAVTLLPVPVVSAIGSMAFPKLAAREVITAANDRLMRTAVLLSAALAVGILLPAVLVAGWLVPRALGAGYQGAVPLMWILAPGGIFLACGQVAGDLLRGARSPATVAYSQWAAAVATGVLLVVLLPALGVAGAAVASTVAYGIALAAMTWVLWRRPAPAAGLAPGTGTPAAPAPNAARAAPATLG